MATVRAVSVDHPHARALLEEYFALRATIFPDGRYRVVTPDAGAFTPPRGVFVVVYDGDEPTGCGGIRRIPDGPTGARFEVKHLYVRDAGRGRGWGRMLLQELERRAAEAGATEIVLDTHHTLEAAAHLYTRSGYSEIEPYNDNANATVWLGKMLPTS